MTEEEKKNLISMINGGAEAPTAEAESTETGLPEAALTPEAESTKTGLPEAVPEAENTDAPAEKNAAAETETPAAPEKTDVLPDLLQKIDAVGVAVGNNAETLDRIVNKVFAVEASAAAEAKNADALADLNAKLTAANLEAEKNARAIDEIKSEMLALHRLYQNDFAGRIRNMEVELERYHKRDAGLAFDGIYKEIGQVYIDFEDLGAGVEDSRLSKNIRYLLEEIEELLLSHGVERMKSNCNEKRNLSFTQVVDHIPTADPALDGYVAKSISSGFYIEKRCLHKERVNVYRYEQPAVVSEEEKETVVPESAAAENTSSEEQ